MAEDRIERFFFLIHERFPGVASLIEEPGFRRELKKWCKNDNEGFYRAVSNAEKETDFIHSPLINSLISYFYCDLITNVKEYIKFCAGYAWLIFFENQVKNLTKYLNVDNIIRRLWDCNNHIGALGELLTLSAITTVTKYLGKVEGIQFRDEGFDFEII